MKHWVKIFLVGCLFILAHFIVLKINFPAQIQVKHIVLLLGLIFSFIGLALLSINRINLIIGNICIIVTLLLVFELVTYFALGLPAYPKMNRKLGVNDKTNIAYQVGHGPWAMENNRSKVLVGDRVIYDVLEHYDSLGRRVNTIFNTSNKNYALFTGCSVCYSQGCEDNQTLPHYFQKNTKNYNSYNYAFPGWGPSNTLALYEYKNIKNEINEKEGIGFYVFVWAQLGRVIGDFKSYNYWAKGYPYYFLRDNKLVRNDNFIFGRYWVSLAYDVLWRSSIVRYFEVTFPHTIKPIHIELLAEVLNQIKHNYIKQFGNDKFYVLIYPTSLKQVQKKHNGQLIELLKQKEINYLDYSKTVKTTIKNIYKNDGHPMPHMHEKIAQILANELKLIHSFNAADSVQTPAN